MKLVEVKRAIAKYLEEIDTRKQKKSLIGMHGQTFLSAGFVYAPYVPLFVTPIFETLARPNAPLTQKEMKRLVAIALQKRDQRYKTTQTSYFNKKVRTDFFGTITVNRYSSGSNK